MKNIKFGRLVGALIVGLVALGLTGCGKKQRVAEIERLNAELVEEQDRAEAQREEHRLAQTENRKVVRKLREVEHQLAQQERQTENVRRNLERAEQRIAAAREVKERTPSNTEKRDLAKKKAEELLGAVVSITGDKSALTGFLVEADGKNWIYMPAGALSGNSKLEVSTSSGGKLTKFGSFEIASDSDLARLEVKDEIEKGLVLSDPQQLKSGVSLLGVDEAGALVEGRAYGGGENSLRVDTRLAACPMGSPVFHGETGQLLGMLSEEKDQGRFLWDAEGGNESRQRAEVNRLDRTIAWTVIPIGVFLEEAKVIAAADVFTRLMSAFASVSPSNKGLNMSGGLGGGKTVEMVLEENKKLSAVRSLYALDKWLKESGERASDADYKRKVNGLFDEILRDANRQTKTFEQRKFSPYHAPSAAESLEWRREAASDLNNLRSVEE